MGNRLQLQSLLEDLIGSSNVYFQPPESQKINYPCIIYSLNNVDTNYADDKPYIHKNRYQIMVIDRNPDSEIPGKVALLTTSIFSRRYSKDNLNHTVYNIYY